jgi:hypothetical protein
VLFVAVVEVLAVLLLLLLLQVLCLRTLLLLGSRFSRRKKTTAKDFLLSRFSLDVCWWYWWFFFSVVDSQEQCGFVPMRVRERYKDCLWGGGSNVGCLPLWQNSAVAARGESSKTNVRS